MAVAGTAVSAIPLLIGILSVFGFIALLGTAASSTPKPAAATSTTTTQPPVEIPVDVSAVDLAGDYEANELAGDAEYKGKRVRVDGTIETIGKDILGHPYVVLKGKERSIRGVQCTFSTADAGRLVELRKGERTRIVGRCKGLMMNVQVEAE
jgi:hypothetical protein